MLGTLGKKDTDVIIVEETDHVEETLFKKPSSGNRFITTDASDDEQIRGGAIMTRAEPIGKAGLC